MTKTFRFIGMALMAVLMSVGLAACSSDDDDISDISNIYGTWEKTHSEGWDKVNGEIEDKWNSDLSNQDEFDQYLERFVFSENGKLSIYYKEGSKWYSDGTYNYTISGNKLYIEDYDSDDERSVMTIKTLSESVLVLEGSSSETEDGEKYESYMKETFKKVD